MRFLTLIVALSLVAAMLLSLSGMQKLHAWSLDPSANTPICTATYDQTHPDMVPDGSGGAIISWQDYRSGSSLDIFAQRINAPGTPMWMDDGIAICTANGDQAYPALIADGSGGAIIVWQDYRGGNYDIFVQRVDASGELLWTDGGVAICTANSDQGYPALIADGSGGAIVAWQDYRSGGNYDIYAQRVNASGELLWTDGGAAICTTVRNQVDPCLATDGSGGAVVVWEDGQSLGWETYWDGVQHHTHYESWGIYAQRVTASGEPLWTSNGVEISARFNSQEMDPCVLADGSGGALVAWTRYWSGIGDICVQRVSPSGTLQWSRVAICSATGNQILTGTSSDGAGGMLLMWEDSRSGVSSADRDIYAQKVNPSGVPQWTVDGLAICTCSGSQGLANAVADGSGGAIIAWTDYRSGRGHIYAQRVNSSGMQLWTDNGLAICSAADRQVGTPMIGDGSGGAILAWMDWRSGSYCDIYAQRVGASGALNSSPSQPVNTYPGGGATDVGLTPILYSSAFSDPDSGDTHSASQWRITTAAGDYSNPVFDSGTDNTNLVEIAVPLGTLKSDTAYYWQVRYQDGHGDWSVWSEECSFAVQEESSSDARTGSRTWIWIVVGIAAVAIPAGGIGVWRLRSAKRSGSSHG